MFRYILASIINCEFLRLFINIVTSIYFTLLVKLEVSNSKFFLPIVIFFLNYSNLSKKYVYYCKNKYNLHYYKLKLYLFIYHFNSFFQFYFMLLKQLCFMFLIFIEFIFKIRNTCVSTGNNSSSEAKPRWKDGRGFNPAQRPLLIPLNRLLNFWYWSDEFEKQARTKKVTNTVRGYLYPVHRTPTDDPIYGEGMGKVRVDK